MNCECAICKNNVSFDLPDEIVDATIKGDLVLFCGAGISTEGKDILPDSFYTSIKNELGIEDDSISFSHLMQQYCAKPDGRKKLLMQIRNRFNYIHSFPEIERQASEFHRELAQIYSIKTIITTNWDTYFEDYCAAIPITIPQDFAFWDDNSRFVLKIHGSIQNLSTIIATSEDYEKCLNELKYGAIGARLKAILTTKTVVFVGYSFGDEDFAQIINYLRNEMGEFYPHIYFVTLDETLKDRLGYKNSTSIVTSGTFFLHTLRNVLIDKGIIKNCSIYPILDVLLEKIKQLHSLVADIDCVEYPCVIYTLSYQDGVIHAFERFMQNYHTGEYNQPGYALDIATNYMYLIEQMHKVGDYWNEAYYDGYATGLVIIERCERDRTILKEFPYLYLPSAKQQIENLNDYKEELAKVSHRSKYYRYAKNMVDKMGGSKFIFHHRPL